MSRISLDALKRDFSGEVIVPEDPGYDDVKNSFVHSGAPLVVFKCKDSNDVKRAIQYGREHSLVISVRSGGHSNAGHSTNVGGIVIDLSLMNSVEVIDLDNHIVRIGAGAHWGDVATVLEQHHLAISSGDTVTVGVGGLTLGGGIGWMVRKYGMTIDHLLAATMVTAAGEEIRVSSDEHPDLFWAIRGGGGNFGVAINFEFKAHPVGKVFAGMVSYSLDNLGGLLRGWRNVMRDASDDLTTMFLVMPSFMGNPPAAMALVCYAGDDEAAALKEIEPLMKIGTVVHSNLKMKEYAEVLEEAHAPQGVKIVTLNGIVADFSDAMIDGILEAQKIKPDLILQLRSLGGAMNRVPVDGTAFAHRDGEVLVVAPTFMPPTADDVMVAQMTKYWDPIAKFTTGAYCGFFSEETGNEMAALYPAETLARLKKVKKQYDPENVFHRNYNVKPE